MKQENEIVKNQVILNRGLYRWAAPRSVFVRGLVNYRFQDLQRWLLQLKNNVRGRCQIKFGMTSLCNNGGRKGFTLIELLVVVLIIGILAAIALPQYQKAVEKSRAAEAIALLKSVYIAQTMYYLNNGTFAKKFDQLDIDIPWTGNTKWEAGSPSDTRSNDNWSLQMNPYDSVYTGPHVQIGRISGPYRGGGFIMYFNPTHAFLEKNRLFCGEYETTTQAANRFQKKRGDFCVKVMGVNDNNSYPGAIRAWKM